MPDESLADRSSDKLQSAIYYGIDGDQVWHFKNFSSLIFKWNVSGNVSLSLPQVEILELLTQQGDDHWLPWQQKRPLLHIACERGAWSCVKYLVAERPEEINQCYDEYYPLHQVKEY